ncbi:MULTISPECIES: siderophore-interacting protein [unclassified Pseudomonas]|uniref:siderophore-interacting protein n=1 Tax=unclassified Pseudomonas TaxID=196821 RepID=UPI002447A8A1|nr:MULTISPECIES: siderophore-interacting protein [unclassified Pseudomonas]MDG9931267.1 siderophore-interacting protein [Pseudomonas sp. GD04042]MDH0485648.1 siderophore-interacting protein [Pseudomonas sp. GD04015]MDH0607149.1 siderophore-interacting protein [Pseudomonas sp. GD03869]
MSLAETLAQNLRNLAQRTGLTRASSYSLFDVELKRRTELSPSLGRFVFTGPDVARMRTLAPDQRIKLLFPAPDGSPPQLPHEGDWHKNLRALDPQSRPPMRTYTIRALRHEALEVDVDFVLHGETGPASAWATHARPGDRLQMVAPDIRYPSDPGGYEWRPPTDVRHVLLIGDETALPAIAGIIEQLAERQDAPVVQAFLEIPTERDALPLPRGPLTRLHWLPRAETGARHGARMIEAAHELATLPSSAPREENWMPLDQVDIDRELPWELASPVDTAFYAWVAGESAAVMAIRRHFIGELGLDRRASSFMGYWRHGKVLG